MVSGAIGGFLDVALNFNTQAMVDDNLLGKLIPAKVVNHI
jgi:ethanolaminephosphotransferase